VSGRAATAATIMEPRLSPLLPDFDVPPPVLLNTWKHHAAALRCRIRAAVRAGTDGVRSLAGGVVVIGTELMDLYTGRLSPADIAAGLLALLRAEGRLEPEPYQAWLAGRHGYALLTLPADGSRWVLRLAEGQERYVHVHPGRYSPWSRRVRANVLKTAVVALAQAGVEGQDPLDRDLVNRARRLFLGLPPIGRTPAEDAGLGEVIALLRQPAASEA
jgi:hypothetical protein